MLAWLKRWLFGREKSTSSLGTSDPALLVYVKIPESIGPIDRGEKYEDPLQAKLNEKGLVEVSGGGSQLGNERVDGTRPIEFCGLDVDVTDLEKALVLMRDNLPSLGAPVGTELHYTRRGVRLQDELHSEGWVREKPRSFLHPGFGL